MVKTTDLLSKSSKMIFRVYLGTSKSQSVRWKHYELWLETNLQDFIDQYSMNEKYSIHLSICESVYQP